MTIQAKLHFLQAITGLTQIALAQRLGVSFVSLNRWYHGKAVPRRSGLQRIDRLLRTYTDLSVELSDPLLAWKTVLRRRAQQGSNVLGTIMRRPDLRDDFMLQLTYTSNRIEGSTLTEAETAVILFHNVTVPRKALVEQLEAKNHQTALDHLFRHLAKKGSLTEELLLTLHCILMNGIRDDAGHYRRYAVRIVGANVPTANFQRVPSLMAQLVKEVQQRSSDPIRQASITHSTFEQIHPFSDGNGRIGRLLLHAMLLKANLPPVVVRPERRRQYYSAINLTQRQGDSTALEELICRGIMDGYRILERA